ncbi:sestrin-3-like isoform X1 [Protopterus annectens]|uniref:sestrin-3-like isoform X1 n=2 Tax=Protopterus annectens TaxID=7888 RepID=UPI001CFB9363|nr:sestrin-3-like isoform X1 [Protopterus annectens]
MIIYARAMEYPQGNLPSTQSQVTKGNCEQDHQQLFFIKTQASRGRLDSVTQQMGYHPQYLDHFLKLQHYLLHVDGPLPFDCRHYIAMIAAARHQCRYLVNLHMSQFLRVGGNPEWLQGLEFIPQRLRKLHQINKILAHRPWLINKEHIESLLKTCGQCWTLAELVHAVVILAHCHALASFVSGSGCDQESRIDCRSMLKPTLLGNQCFCDAANGNTNSQELLRINRRKSQDSCVEQDMLWERMQRIHIENEHWDEGCCDGQKTLPYESDEDIESCSLSFLVEDPSYGYQDFARRDEDNLQVFRVQDYSWEVHGFSLANRLYCDIGNYLDAKFRTVYNLQNGLLAKRQGCDSAVFQRAVWNYIHCMFGIRYDDYDYSEVNHLLERNLKVYIKTVTCYPEKINSQMFDHFWKQFKHSEKVHVNLLIFEARMQAELLYALRAITEYMIA